ncbi:hypothetical protein [Mixta intestinalis]|uniref:Capsule polysaccharide biosynthesis protein n=1 Tax=Mixta intestinalis TaxID=1615494 RepID=A0A6P1Q159_9GAMM|nr:hypothetical protein [Mixta intestinalis]QHM71585.1 hypothetical protein C7M51_01876 [Mixta intestinalis]
MRFIFLLHDDLRVKLYARLKEKAHEYGIKSQFLCFSIACYKSLIRLGFKKDSLLVYDDLRFLNIISNKELSNSIDVIASFLTVSSAQKVASSTYAALIEQTAKGSTEEVVIFGGNGLHVFDKVAKFYASQYQQVYTVFTELANIEGKVFFDPEGSNASSLFYELLKNNKIDFSQAKNVEGFDKWREEYCYEKLKDHTVPQVKSFSHKKNIIHRIYGACELLTKVSSYQKLKLLDVLSNKNKIVKKIDKSAWLPWLEKEIKCKDYIFFPLQVFSDSQVKLHSHVDVKQALIKAMQIAKEDGIPLLVKPHPAEFDSKVIDIIIGLKKEQNFLLSDDNTFKLIKNSQKVIVINSTVGLEAILLGKHVEFLGLSFYKYLQDDYKMNYYINHWLIDIDIFSPSPLKNEVFDKIVSIAKMKK